MEAVDETKTGAAPVVDLEGAEETEGVAVAVAGQGEGDLEQEGASNAEQIAQLLVLLDPETLGVTYRHNQRVLVLHKKLERAKRFGQLILDEDERKIIRAIRFGSPLADESQKQARLERFKDVLGSSSSAPDDPAKLIARAKRFGLPVVSFISCLSLSLVLLHSFSSSLVFLSFSLTVADEDKQSTSPKKTERTLSVEKKTVSQILIDRGLD